MNKILATSVLAGVIAAVPSALAQSFIELQQDATRYNLQSTNGVPISHTPGNPPGSDGRAPGPNPGPVGTVRQFQGIIPFGALVVPKSASLDPSKSYAANSENLDLPR